MLEDFLGEHRPDFWISDRYGGQKGLARSGHQFCLAHLIRDAQYAIDAGDTGFAPGLLALLKRACRLGAIRERLSDPQLAAYHRKFVKKLSELLQRPPTHAKGAKLQKAMAKGRGNLFLFVTNRALEPTNNGSERALRPCVTFRKITGGFRTPGAPPPTPTPARCWRPPDAAPSRPLGHHPHPQRMPAASPIRLQGEQPLRENLRVTDEHGHDLRLRRRLRGGRGSRPPPDCPAGARDRPLAAPTTRKTRHGPFLNFAAKRLEGRRVADRRLQRRARTALAAYRKRWAIECLFGDAKTRGLNLEDTRLTAPRKLDLLMAIVALALAWPAAPPPSCSGRTPPSARRTATSPNPGSASASTDPKSPDFPLTG